MSLGVYTEFEHTPRAAVHQIIQEELAAIMIPIGLQLNWRCPHEKRPDQWRPQVSTIYFRGECEGVGSPSSAKRPWVFGRTYISGSEVIPYAEIDCDSIREFLVPALTSSLAPHRTAIFGRAVARVLAHEIYHILANTKDHGSGGTAKAFYTLGEVAADEFRFQDREARRLQWSISPHPPKSSRSGWHGCRRSETVRPH